MTTHMIFSGNGIIGASAATSQLCHHTSKAIHLTMLHQASMRACQRIDMMHSSIALLSPTCCKDKRMLAAESGTICLRSASFYGGNLTVSTFELSWAGSLSRLREPGPHQAHVQPVHGFTQQQHAHENGGFCCPFRHPPLPIFPFRCMMLVVVFQPLKTRITCMGRGWKSTTKPQILACRQASLIILHAFFGLHQAQQESWCLQAQYDQSTK